MSIYTHSTQMCTYGHICFKSCVSELYTYNSVYLLVCLYVKGFEELCVYVSLYTKYYVSVCIYVYRMYIHAHMLLVILVLLISHMTTSCSDIHMYTYICTFIRAATPPIYRTHRHFLPSIACTWRYTDNTCVYSVHVHKANNIT